MKRFAKLETWLHGLIGGFIGGGSSAAASFFGVNAAHGAGLDVPVMNLKAAAVVFVTAGLASAAAYLKQSPLPPLDAPEATPPKQ